MNGESLLFVRPCILRDLRRMLEPVCRRPRSFTLNQHRGGNKAVGSCTAGACAERHGPGGMKALGWRCLRPD